MAAVILAVTHAHNAVAVRLNNVAASPVAIAAHNPHGAESSLGIIAILPLIAYVTKPVDQLPDFRIDGGWATERLPSVFYPDRYSTDKS